MDSYLWKESKWEDINKEIVRPYNKDERRVYTKKEEGVSIVKARKKRSMRVYQKTIEKRVYQILKVISNGTSVFCRKEGQ